MMKRRLLLSAMLSMAVLFNLTSCKDDGINWDYENAINLKNIGAEYGSKSFKIEELRGATLEDSTITLSAGSTGVSGQKIKFDIEYGIVGESLTKVENVSSATLHFDKPFEEYVINLVYWGEDEDGNVSKKSNVVEVNFCYVPPMDFSVFRDFGRGEYATTLKWHFGHIKYDREKDDNGYLLTYFKSCVTHYEDGYYVVGDARELRLYDDDNYSLLNGEATNALYPYKKTYQEPTEKELAQMKKKLSQMKVVIETSSDDVQCNIDPIEIAYNADSIK